MNNQSEKPIEELLRGVPQDHRICIPFQWAEDGRETGHHYIPVGRHVHQAADKITALREELTKCKVALADRDSAWRLYKEAREAEVQQASRADEAVTKNAALREHIARMGKSITPAVFIVEQNKILHEQNAALRAEVIDLKNAVEAEKRGKDELREQLAALREKLVQALAIAKKYEPDEKTSYVKYASDEIAELLKEEGE